jgi:hypothetical protein
MHLKNCALVCREWREWAQKYLFESVRVNDEWGAERVGRTLGGGGEGDGGERLRTFTKELCIGEGNMPVDPGTHVR